jgi:hypothetical protein
MAKQLVEMWPVEWPVTFEALILNSHSMTFSGNALWWLIHKWWCVDHSDEGWSVPCCFSVLLRRYLAILFILLLCWRAEYGASFLMVIHLWAMSVLRAIACWMLSVILIHYYSLSTYVIHSSEQWKWWWALYILWYSVHYWWWVCIVRPTICCSYVDVFWAWSHFIGISCNAISYNAIISAVLISQLIRK